MSASKNCSVNRKRPFPSSTTVFTSVLTTANSIDHSTCFKDDVQLPERKKSAKGKIQSHHQQQIVTDTNTTATGVPHRTASQRSVPAFLHKLFNMVNDGFNTHLVRWSEDGNSFLVQGHEEFAQSVLPRFYKHNTFASFVRQLNMYDFHKVPHLQQGVLIAADNTENEVWEFSHPQFKRGRPDLLISVTRKRNRDREHAPDTKQVDLGSIVKDLTAIRKHQTSITVDLSNLHKDNEMIWKEALIAREKHQRHQKIISKILQFLTVVFSNDQHQLNVDEEQDTLFCSLSKGGSASKDGKIHHSDDNMTINVPSVKTNIHAKLDAISQQENHEAFHLESYNCKSNTCNDVNKSSTSAEDSSPLTFVLCQFLKTVDSYHTDPPFSCVRGTASPHVNETKDAVCQSGFIPCDTSSSDLTLDTPSNSNELFFREVQKRRAFITPTFHNIRSESERYGSSASIQHHNQFIRNPDYIYNTITDTDIRNEYQAKPSYSFRPVMSTTNQHFVNPQPVNNNNNNTCSQQVGDNNTHSQQNMDSAMFMN